jgi:hypothetical protein
MSIVVGVVGILLFQKAFHHRQELAVAAQDAEATAPDLPHGSDGDLAIDAVSVSAEAVPTEVPIDPAEAEAPGPSPAPPSNPQA